MKFIKPFLHANSWFDAQQRYCIRLTVGSYYVYEGRRYIGTRSTFDDAVALAEREANK